MPGSHPALKRAAAVDAAALAKSVAACIDVLARHRHPARETPPPMV